MRGLLSLVLVIALCGAARADMAPDAKPITWKSCSGSIATGNVAQTVTMGSGPLRAFFIQNPSTATESLFFDPSGTANGSSSPELQKGDWANFGPATIFVGNTISVFAATGGHAFTCQFGQ